MPRVEWFATCFPGRRADCPVVEITLSFRAQDNHGFPQKVSQITELLISGGILSPDEQFPFEKLPEDRRRWYASLLAQTALLFQRKAGHRVRFFSVLDVPDKERCIALVEHEHCDVGMTAAKLAGELMTGKLKFLAEPFRVISEFARERLLPRDTEAIIAAAGRRDIPHVKLERRPYKRSDFDHITGGECVRRNGLLMLGHGVHQRVLDGTFNLDESSRLGGLLHDRRERRAVMANLDMPLADAEDEKSDGGSCLRLIAVNGKVTAGLAGDGGHGLPVDSIHPSLTDLATLLNRELGLGPVSLTIESSDPNRPLEDTGGHVVDFELAPDLDRLSDVDTASLDATATGIVDWLFPDDGNVRMPTFAVTGTNGKTTTSRMISHIMAGAGHKPGLVCTDGVYLDGRHVVSEDLGADKGHLMVLTSKEADVAVLESHHIGIIYRGFAFERCDVAVCLNVTLDHLGVAHVDSVEQMAEVKRAVPESARLGAVLNADDPLCLAMTDGLTAERTCLVSMVLPAETLADGPGPPADVICVLEDFTGEETIVIHDQGCRIPIIAAGRIPATFEGRARFNVGNAMHAVAAAYLMGVEPETISTSMTGFGMSYENTPGRLNVYDGLPFKAIMDYAHNVDGFEKLGAFIDRLETPGRKLLMFQVRSDFGEGFIEGVTAAAASHFDHFVCRPHPVYSGMDDDQALGLIKKGLMDSGVEEKHITAVMETEAAVETMLQMGREGDLLVFAPGGKQREATWKRIVSFSPRKSPE